ncbi:pre-mRNA-splicing factor CWC22-like [Salvia splendens]|uniref:pre-mRNA-splicing factor CWC22-like n=1 Tax=Salvia splendens TaxID=180675 RepID=UPI001C27B7D4|nr:pre-mRNA-splicing factor CWC22-like [Salvia splendens]
MGCCISTNKSTPPHKTGHIPSSTTINGSVSKSPPPSHPIAEEETVKEVLSETPKPPIPIPNFQGKRESPFIKSAPLLKNKDRHTAVGIKPPFSADDLSEASEICSSLSESVSASTSVTDRRAELRELRQRSPARSRNRPFSGELPREKTVGRSPARRSEPSPGRARPVPASGYGRRRENGESSGRRSRSPVTRADPGLGRAQSARRTGKSPGRVAPGSAEKVRKLDGGKESGGSKWPPTNGSNESLDNPLVSLECFIFL